MKTRILIAIFTVGMSMGVFAQNTTITLTFTADSNSHHLPLNSILIENLTQGGDTTLYSPDTTLVLDFLTGMDDDKTMEDVAFSVSQNYPNPVEDKTTIVLYLPEKNNVLINIRDIMGKDLLVREYQLNSGSHSLTFFPGNESLYFLTARVNHQSRTIKMLRSQSHVPVSGLCKLEYNGQHSGSGVYKSRKILNDFVFNAGDLLGFSGYTDLGERSITSSPTSDQTYYFHYTGDPCPGIPSVTDIDSNTYNTVQIGSQCWMKENLKTTRYSDGTTIPNVTDTNEWKNLTTDAYVWYNNDSTWKDEYGALYNWYTTVDSAGLCPTGWHVPSHDEWAVLTDYIGGFESPRGNELKSCRQVNHPLGGDCNVTDHPRWSEDNTQYGTDDYNFSCLPGGNRKADGIFFNIGYGGRWWTSTKHIVYNMSYARLLFSYHGYLAKGPWARQSGFSIRCLKD